ncbi:MAG: ABC transporter substrate-binding protein, partial [Gammaproteobacteria bacterium]
MISKRLLVAALAIAGLVLGSNSLAQTTKVRVGIPSHAMSQIAFYMAKDKGFYADEGLDVELILMRGPVSNTALIAKEVHFTTVPVAGLTAAIQG